MTEPSSISFDGWTLHRDSGELNAPARERACRACPFRFLTSCRVARESWWRASGTTTPVHI